MRHTRPPGRQPKGHIFEGRKAEREKQIAANMAKMPKWIAESKVCNRLMCWTLLSTGFFILHCELSMYRYWHVRDLKQSAANVWLQLNQTT
jgi:hypothetical protein